MDGNLGFEFHSWVKPLPAYAVKTIAEFPHSVEEKVTAQHRTESGQFNPADVCEALDQKLLETWGVIDPGLDRTGGFSMLGENAEAPEIHEVFHLGLDLLKVARKKFGDVHLHEFQFVMAFAHAADALPTYLCQTEVRFKQRDEYPYRHRLLTPEGKAKLIEILGKKVSTPRSLGDAWVKSPS